ncbi:MAG: 50S ribosomal protein L3 [Calditrichaeota bacterium]|nr:50S ribosomal protein L3 [Calditrichota bacterium]MCB9472291.1 50S ribosomal protein L3 [Candidatus Delongbacteria bacterium]
MSAILGRKLGMTQIFDEAGNCVPVTMIEAGPCFVTQKKTAETDGYAAVQLSFGELRANRANRPMAGHFKKSGVKPARHLREFDAPALLTLEVGAQVNCDSFREGDMVTVSGTSKGRGYTGVMKAHNFAGFKASHGVHESYRGPGSVGASSDPSRTYRGMKMAGRHGNDRVSVKNLRIVKIIPDQNLILVKGAVPGARNGLLEIRK